MSPVQEVGGSEGPIVNDSSARLWSSVCADDVRTPGLTEGHLESRGISWPEAAGRVLGSRLGGMFFGAGRSSVCVASDETEGGGVSGAASGAVDGSARTYGGGSSSSGPSHGWSYSGRHCESLLGVGQLRSYIVPSHLCGTIPKEEGV